MKRRRFINNSAIVGGLLASSPAFATKNAIGSDDFPIIDLHVHTSKDQTIEDIVNIAFEKDIQFGVVEHPEYSMKDDVSLLKYIENLRQYPVFAGLQPTGPGWSKNFSTEALAKVDYVLMDPQFFEEGNSYGDPMRIYSFDTYVDDTNKFMKAYMDYTLEVITNDEPLDILSWPLFLPVCIARDYYSLWTEKRMNQIISAAKEHNVAIEINDLAHTPHEEFIKMAKNQGLKFTFGSDTRDQKTGRLDYCKYIAKKCNLTKDDFFIPQRKA